MVFSVSPSVTVKEVDLTTTIPAITTPPAAIVGVFRWGPINQRVLISSENELAAVFGAPSNFNAETFFTAADFLSYSNALYVTRVVGTTAATATASVSGETVFGAKYPGVLGNSLGVSYVSTSNSGVTTSFQDSIIDVDDLIAIKGADADTYADLTDVAVGEIVFGTRTFFIVTSQNSIDLASGDILRVGGNDVGFQDLFVSSVTTTSEEVGPDTIYTHKIQTSTRYALPEFSLTNLTLSRLWRYAGNVSAAPTASNMHIIVYDVDGKISGTAGQILEKFENVSTISTAKLDDGTNNFYKDVLETRSRYISATDFTINPSLLEREYVTMIGGADGDSESSASMFGRIAQGYDLYKEGNDVDIAFILQGKAVSPNLANYIVSNIAEYRRDCMAFLSPRRVDVVDVSSPQVQLDNVLAYRNSIQNSSYWMMDSGYKYRYDKYNDVYRWVPLNGDSAGLASRVEPWESPAGFRKGKIRNVIKLAFNPNKAQRDQLYGKDINPVISQVGQGTILFGDKTGLGTATGSAFTRINVRRLFITIEKAIATISAQFLFEFNDEFTQNQFRQVVDPFLRDIQGRRGIIDFRVISDATINTPDVIDRNIFRANIFVKPARSINFIELTFIATRTGVQFEEIVGQQF